MKYDLEKEKVEALELTYNSFNLSKSLYISSQSLMSLKELEEKNKAFSKAYNECSKDYDLDNSSIDFTKFSISGDEFEMNVVSEIEENDHKILVNNFEKISLYKELFRRLSSDRSEDSNLLLEEIFRMEAENSELIYKYSVKEKNILFILLSHAFTLKKQRKKLFLKNWRFQMKVIKEINLTDDQIKEINKLNSTLVSVRNLLKEFREGDSDYAFEELTEKLVKTQEEYDGWFSKVGSGVVTTPENSWNVDFDQKILQLMGK